ncbi:hypothetical protein E8E13_003606 [Curvularia kusanoi]|uniref:Uncharacterized protein n=1 Tax=Curvularia kusanoi TaxID=90978 RepID=A0A9P4TCB5_CURKU|nr:hypothetical protein E8E13_003606 [Curvularia kusanoi]
MSETVSEIHDSSELPPFDNKLVASAAAALDAANIPNILWGHYMLTIFGVPTVVVVRIDFVVDDDFIDTANATLLDSGFKKCISNDCLSSKELGYAPKPHTHLHITESLHLCFHKKSNILWRISDLTNVDGESIILASDPDQLPGLDIIGRGGRFAQDLHPVRVPTISQLVVSLLLLATRDSETKMCKGPYWMNWVTYVAEYCTENGDFDINQLSGNYKIYMQSLIDSDGDVGARRQALKNIGLEK